MPSARIARATSSACYGTCSIARVSTTWDLFDYVWAGRIRVFPFFWNLRETPVFSWHEGSIYRHLEEYDATEIAQALVDRVYSGHILLADAEAVVPEPIRWSAWVSPLSRFASRMGPRGAGFSDNAEPRKGHGGL